MSDKDDRSRAERSAAMATMLKQMASTEYQAAMATAESAEQRRADAEKKLARRKELLENAPAAGSVKNLEDAEVAVSNAEKALTKTEQDIKALRGDYYGDVKRPESESAQDTTPSPASMMADSASTGNGDAWKSKARVRAVEIIERQRAKDLYPSQEIIADEIAKEFRAAELVGADGKPLSGATIKRHALSGISSAQGKQMSTSIRRGK